MKVKQSIPKHLRFTIRDFNTMFPNDESCLEHLKEQRFPGGVTHCDTCEQERKFYRVAGRPAYACAHCGKMISPMEGTIFHKSSTPLKTWFYAMYLMSSTRCGISAKQIQRETGVTYKTAWRMFKQIRSLLSDGDLQLEGPTVEVDESFFGGVQKWGRGREMAPKVPVIGIVQRGGKVLARVIPAVTKKELLGAIRKHVKPGSVIYTDELGIYKGIPKLHTRNGRPARYKHFAVKHRTHYVKNGHIHTQAVEGLWSLIKRGIGGVYHSVSPAYLQTYLNEYTFRYNRRHNGNLQFKSVLERACERVA